MKIEYLLQLKKEPSVKNVELDARIRNALEQCFHGVTADSFSLSEKENKYRVQYHFVEHRVNIKNDPNLLIYMTFSYESKRQDHTARVLDNADLRFIRHINLGDSKYCIIRIYDERSIYYCIRAYPMFCSFESKLRCLILKMLTKIFGYLWAKETISPELRPDLEKRVQSSNDEKLATDALYEMDYNVLVKFLFTPYRAVTTDARIDELLADSQLETKKIVGFRNILEEIKLASNWQRFFKDIEINKPEETLTQISKQRNKIAHSKHYTFNDYSSDSKMVLNLIKQIDQAIRTVEVKPISNADALAAVGSLVDFNLINVSKIASNFGIILEGILKATINIRAAYKDFTPAIKILSEYLVRAKNDYETASDAEDLIIETETPNEYELTDGEMHIEDNVKSRIEEEEKTEEESIKINND